MKPIFAAELLHEQGVDPTAWLVWVIPLAIVLALAVLVGLLQMAPTWRR